MKRYERKLMSDLNTEGKTRLRSGCTFLIPKYLETPTIKQGSCQNGTPQNNRQEAEVMVAVSGS